LRVRQRLICLRFAPRNSVHPFSIFDVEPNAGKSIDNTKAFDRAIELASREGIGTIWIPPGEYPIRSLRLRGGVILRGSGRGATVISALASSEPAIVTLDEGPVLYSGLSGLTLQGGSVEKATNPGQWGMQLKAAPAPQGRPHGGLWWSHFEDVGVNNFDRGIALEGGGKSYLLPHQFFSMRDMQVIMPMSAVGPNLLLSGQVNQGMFQQIHFDSLSTLVSSAIHLMRDSSGEVGPGLHHFDLCTVQSVPLGFLIDSAQNITISNTWFENDGAGVHVLKDSFAINILQNHFANAGQDAPAIRFDDGTSGSVRENLFAGPRTRGTVEIARSAKVQCDDGTIIWGAQKTR
jgi:hypothetical protein